MQRGKRETKTFSFSPFPNSISLLHIMWRVLFTLPIKSKFDDSTLLIAKRNIALKLNCD